MIDLSFLTEEEQETILTVLNRDAELKKAEEKRVQNLQKTINDKRQLRYLTGEWFYETKQRRHQDRIHGSDIIKASMRQSQKPLTILELTHILPAKPSFVSSEHKEVFVPSVLCGLLEDPEEQPSRYGNQIHNDETVHTYKTVLQSPMKMRKNPFDTDLTSGEKKNHVPESRLSPDSLISMTTDPQEASVLDEKPENRVKRISSQETFANVKGSNTVDQMAFSKNVATEMWADSKKIILSSESQSPAERQDGSNLREHSLVNVKPPPCEEQSSDNRNSTSTSTHKLFYRQSPKDLREGGETESNFQEHGAGQPQFSGDASEKYDFDPLNPTVPSFVLVTEEPCKPVDPEKEHKKNYLCQAQAKDWSDKHKIHYIKANPDIKPSPTDISKNVSHVLVPKCEEKIAQVHIPPKKERTISKQNTNEERYSKDPTDMSDKNEIETTQMTKVRLLQLAALQKTSFKETLMSLDVDTKQKDRSIDQSTQCSNRPSHLKAFSEDEQSIFKLRRTGEKEKQKDAAKTVTEAFDYPQTSPSTPPQTDYNRLINVSKDYGTYGANLVLIHEETDDLVTDLRTGLQITEPQQNKISSKPNLAFNTQKQELDTRVSPLTQPSSAPEEESFNKIDELRHFWEKENTGHKVISTSEKTPSIKSMSHNSKAFLESDTESDEKTFSHKTFQPPRTTDNDNEARRSPSKTYHPKVLPLESFKAKGSRLDQSPLKTFPIDIDPKTKEQQEEPTLDSRQKKSPSQIPKQTVQTDNDPDEDATYPHPPQSLHSVDKRTCFGHENMQKSSNNSTTQQSEQASESTLEKNTLLTRTFIPKDLQYYLGPQEKAHSPPFHQNKVTATVGSDAAHRLQGEQREFQKNQRCHPTERKSHILENKVGNSSPGITTGTWSLSQENSGYGDISSPLISALKRLSSRNMSSSKSLENLNSQTISPSIKSKTMQSSSSAFDLQKDEPDNDITFQKNPSSSMSDLSLSSRMASMSSMSSSRSSIFPLDSADINIQGSIQFAVNYIQKLGELQIFVVLCRALATADAKKNRSDPYVKCYLLPDKTQLGKRKTSVRKKTSNPSYNEILSFKILMDDLKTQTLNISVWHNDSFGRNSFLGEVDLNLSEWDFNNTEINEYTLKSRVPSKISVPSTLPLTDSRGQMRVALKFVPQTFHSQSGSGLDAGELMVWVKDCRDLPPVRGVVINPFVKCIVLPDMSRRSRQKTRVVKKTTNPLFNHTMVYDGFRPQDLKETCVELTVWDHERLSNHFIGGVRLGPGTGRSYDVEVTWMDSTTNEVTLWQRMFQSNGEWVEDILPLRMLVMAKVMSK